MVKNVHLHGKDVDAAPALEAMAKINADLTAKLEAAGILDALAKHDMVVPGTLVAEVAAKAGKTPVEVADFLIPLSALLSSAPVSSFAVGVTAVVAGSGDVVFGANIEYPGAAMNTTVHAEQSAVARGMARACREVNPKHRGLTSIHLNIVPCGHCRQLLHEVVGGSPACTLYLRGSPVIVADLMPDGFGPAHLGMDPLDLSGPRPIAGALAAPLKQVYPACADCQVDAELKEAALKAARFGYAPYSMCLSGLAVRLTSGKIVTGTIIENAAFNPTISPLAACMSEVIGTGAGWGEIQAAVFVEAAGPKIVQSNAVDARSVLGLIAPKATFVAFTSEC